MIIPQYIIIKILKYFINCNFSSNRYIYLFYVNLGLVSKDFYKSLSFIDKVLIKIVNIKQYHFFIKLPLRSIFNVEIDCLFSELDVDTLDSCVVSLNCHDEKISLKHAPSLKTLVFGDVMGSSVSTVNNCLLNPVLKDITTLTFNVSTKKEVSNMSIDFPNLMLLSNQLDTLKIFGNSQFQLENCAVNLKKFLNLEELEIYNTHLTHTEFIAIFEQLKVLKKYTYGSYMVREYNGKKMVPTFSFKLHSETLVHCLNCASSLEYLEFNKIANYTTSIVYNGKLINNSNLRDIKFIGCYNEDHTKQNIYALWSGNSKMQEIKASDNDADIYHLIQKHPECKKVVYRFYKNMKNLCILLDLNIPTLKSIEITTLYDDVEFDLSDVIVSLSNNEHITEITISEAIISTETLISLLSLTRIEYLSVYVKTDDYRKISEALISNHTLRFIKWQSFIDDWPMSDCIKVLNQLINNNHNYSTISFPTPDYELSSEDLENFRDAVSKNCQYLKCISIGVIPQINEILDNYCISSKTSK
ncbi:hypothetical protein DLAC_04581 [Tieghemostelium lacteum]|uniref:Uncharacterized protein n=1 Tax=Tieghemostelium lacteum TaxID=361077 RepID=A0A151ZJV4_TIELA|nr:hypothetical protein DLAC_04581 [Tieghemostelium lacteum]|eukprot:KYQ94281.1 hypothetical protein DLAC_04581 [Tieghemostelium lacteum]